MIDGTFVQKFADAVKPAIEKLTLNGHDYATGPVVLPPEAPKDPFIDYPSLNLLTLDSIVDFVKNGNSDAAVAQLVCTEAAVHLVGNSKDPWRKRETFAIVRAAIPPVGFGSYQAIEDFRIYLLTQFRDTPDREKVLSFIAKISSEFVATSEDNGVAQSVTVRQGVASHAQALVPSPLQLAPFRTFIEVEQPVGHFLFRMQGKKDSLPEAALFELPNNWKREAALNVKKYLDAKEVGISVYA